MTFIILPRDKCTWDKMRISEVSRINKEGGLQIVYAASFHSNDSVKWSKESGKKASTTFKNILL